MLISFDQFILSVVTLGWSHPDETISSLAYRLEHQGHRWAKYFRQFIDLLFFWQKNHCEKAWHNEIRRAHAPEAIDDLR